MDPSPGFGRFISEGRAVAEAEKRFGRVFQVESKGGCEPSKMRKIYRLPARPPTEAGLLALLSEEDRKKLDAMPDPVVGPLFPEAVRKRVPTGSHAERSHRVATICHLANVAFRCGRPLRFHPVTEQVAGDDEANRLVNQPMRAPWRLQDQISRKHSVPGTLARPRRCHDQNDLCYRRVFHPRI